MIVDFLELIYGILIYLIWDRRFLLAVQIVTTGKAYLIICSDCMVHIFNCFFSLVKTGSFVHSTHFQLLVVKRDWRHHFFSNSSVAILVNDCLRVRDATALYCSCFRCFSASCRTMFDRKCTSRVKQFDLSSAHLRFFLLAPVWSDEILRCGPGYACTRESDANCASFSR